MIPEAHVTAWSHTAPWPEDSQIEQDLILSRFMVEIFEDSLLSDAVAMRGGTAIQKLFFDVGYRYSEDIDLVLLNSENKSEVLEKIETIGMTIFGIDREDIKKKSPDVRDQRIFDYQSEINNTPMDLKIDINTESDTEPFKQLIIQNFGVHSLWYCGPTHILPYQLEELLGTKLRALCDRNRGRDLFDLWLSLDQKSPDIQETIDAFEYYYFDPLPTQERFEEILMGKIRDHTFFNDVYNLIRHDLEYADREALRRVHESVVPKLSGDPYDSDELEQFFEGDHFVQE
jgi:predicted nucleotidyltransferase component of viral defense system